MNLARIFMNKNEKFPCPNLPIHVHHTKPTKMAIALAMQISQKLGYTK